jgi:hypothetical protein
MRLLKAEVKYRLNHRREADARTAEQPPGNFGVKEHPRPVTELGQARQVLGCRMEDGLGICKSGVERGQIRACDGVDQHRPGTVAAELHQEGAMTVPEPGSALGVNGDRTGAASQGLDGGLQRGGAGDQSREAVTRFQQQLDSGLGSLSGRPAWCPFLVVTGLYAIWWKRAAHRRGFRR